MKIKLLNGLIFALSMVGTVFNIILLGTMIYAMYILSLFSIDFSSIILLLTFLYNLILSGLVSYKLFKK